MIAEWCFVIANQNSPVMHRVLFRRAGGEGSPASALNFALYLAKFRLYADDYQSIVP
jgi:hypothetical protein